MKKLAVVIVNYETPELIEKLVQQFSVLDQTLFDLYIIDNSKKYISKYATIRHSINVGFDQAIAAWLNENKHLGYLGYWILNSDITLDLKFDYLRNFINLLEHDNTIGLLSTKVICKKPYKIAQEMVPDNDVWIAKYVDFQSTVLSRQLLQKLNIGSIPYFHGGLDLEINLKAEELGMRVVIDARSTVTHEGQVSWNALDANVTINDHMSRLGIQYTGKDDAVSKNEFLVVKGLSRFYPDIVNVQGAINVKHRLFNTPLISYSKKEYNRSIDTVLPEGLDYLERAISAGNEEAEGIYLTTCVTNGLFQRYVDFSKNIKFNNSGVVGNDDYMRAQSAHYVNQRNPVKTIVFHIAPGPGHAWDAEHTEEGVGGSEIAAIQLTTELAKLGHRIYVFNYCKVPGIYNGVIWDSLDKFDVFEKTHAIDVLVVSRWPEFRFVNPKTRVYFWAHDLNYYNRINATNWQYFDKFLVLSKYHYRFFSSAYPFIPSSYFEIMSNGLDLTRFDQTVERNNKKLIYSSNPDRGVAVLIDMFEELHKWDPKLELHVFGYYPDNIRKSPTYWRDMPGLIYRGYTPQKELAAEYMSSKLWLYPCTWLETFCITAIEAQAAGTPAIASDWGCLRERVGNAGIVIDGLQKNEEHKNKFIKAVKLLLTDEDLWNKYSKAGKEQAKNFSWAKTAEHFIGITNADYTASIR
jgi:glycosyltransferase involved in cell wall biosynthesis/GT2 family glycosyltransferase